MQVDDTLTFKQATDNLGTGHSSVVPLRISLKDANDNPPRFSQEVYRAVIMEGAKDFDPPLVVMVSKEDSSAYLRPPYIIVSTIFPALPNHTLRIALCISPRNQRACRGFRKAVFSDLCIRQVDVAVAHACM